MLATLLAPPPRGPKEPRGPREPTTAAMGEDCEPRMVVIDLPGTVVVVPAWVVVAGGVVGVPVGAAQRVIWE